VSAEDWHKLNAIFDLTDVNKNQCDFNIKACWSDSDSVFNDITIIGISNHFISNGAINNYLFEGKYDKKKKSGLVRETYNTPDTYLIWY